MKRLAFEVLFLFGIAQACACSAIAISDSSASPQVRATQEHAYWVKQVHESSVVAEVEVLKSQDRPDHTLYTLRTVRSWKSDSEQISLAYAPRVPCNGVQLEVGARFVVFAVRRRIPATHQGVPLQLTAAERLSAESTERGAGATLASTHQDRLFSALGQATAARVNLLP
jgi:hypothetical protein